MPLSHPNTTVMNNIKDRDFTPELVFSASRSGGAGGQNVNKVNTKVELRFNIAASVLLTDEEKSILLQKLEAKLTQEGILIIVSQTERTQLRNKEIGIEKFYDILEKSLKVQKKRKSTKPTPASKEKRLESKRIQSQLKSARREKNFL